MGYCLVLVLRLGVIFSHEALQFRELANNLCEQIGFTDPRRTLGLCNVSIDQLRHTPRQHLDPSNSLGLRAKLLVKDDVLELGQPLFEPGL